MNTLLRGFFFGITLQLAIGPVCLYIFHTASDFGFIKAEYGVLAVTIIDATYIGLSLFGFSALLKNNKLQKYLGVLGSIILLIFGIMIVVESISSLSFSASNTIQIMSSQQSFVKALLLTASNPLTIIFWTGVFSSQINKQTSRQPQMLLYALGCIFSTFVFLSAIAFSGKIFRDFLPINILRGLNGLVGLGIITFAILQLLLL